MKYGYARVSTAGQAADGNSLTDQQRKLWEAGCSQVVCEAYTGTKMERPVFTDLLEQLTEGDTLVVTKLDRLARTAVQGVQTVETLMKRGINVHILNMGLVENTPVGRLMLTMLFAFAEFERDVIVERTQEGKAIAKKKAGFREGRPPVEPEGFEDMKDRVDNGAITVVEAARALGISRKTWYNILKRREEKFFLSSSGKGTI